MVHINQPRHGLITRPVPQRRTCRCRLARAERARRGTSWSPADRALEAGCIDTGEVDDRFSHRARCPCSMAKSKVAACAIASRISTPGITGRCGKWPVKNLVDRDVLDRLDAFALVTSSSTTSRAGRCGGQALEDVVDVRLQVFLLLCGAASRVRTRSRRQLIQPPQGGGVLLSQLALSSMG